MKNNGDADTCCKYAYAIAQTGFNGGMIMDDSGSYISITENMVVNALNQVHDAWDAHRELDQQNIG